MILKMAIIVFLFEVFGFDVSWGVWMFLSLLAVVDEGVTIRIIRKDQS